MKRSEFNEQDWQNIENNWTAWWNGTLDRPLVLLTTSDTTDSPGSIHNNLVRFPVDTPPEKILDYYEPFFSTINYHGDAFPRWWFNAGPGIMAAYLGTQIKYADEGEQGTTWFKALEQSSLEDIYIQYDSDNVWWQRTQAITQSAVERWGHNTVISHTDLGGNLDILASLRGTTDLLFDLTDAPDTVEQLTHQITALWLRYYEEMQAILNTGRKGTSYWAGFWSPGTSYMLQSDFSYMISPAMFERFVLPDLVACCQHLDYPFYHMDGKGQLTHLDQFLQIPNLRGIQWQPGDGQPLADDWLEVLARIREAHKLCQVYVKRDGAFKIVEALGGVGFQFQIIEEGLTAIEANEFVDKLMSAAS